MKTFKTFLIILFLLAFTRVNSAIVVINQSGSTFSPKNLTVNVGDIIKWVWSGGTHTTSSRTIPQGAATWDAELTSTSTTFEYTVTVAGSYSYACTIHESMGMTGSFTASVPNSIEQQVLENYRIYPNPAINSIFLPSEIEGKLRVYNILGNEMIAANTQDLHEFNKTSLDVSGLPQGMYFISFFPSDSKKRVTWKFLKK